MAKVTVDTLANLDNPSLAVSQINTNFARLVEAIENTLSRDGTSPNSLGATIDVNSQHLINLPIPTNNTEPARHGDLQQYVDNAEAQADRAESEADDAEASATASQDSADAAAAALASLNQYYMGAFASDPTSGMEAGSLYFNTAENYFRVFADEDVHDVGDVVLGPGNVTVGYWITIPQVTLNSLNDVDTTRSNNDVLRWNAGQSKYLFAPLTGSNISYTDTDELGATDVQSAIDALIDLTSLHVYDLYFWIEGLIGEHETLIKIVANRDFLLPVGLPGSQATVGTDGNIDQTISIRKNGVEIGTLKFTAGATTGVFTFAGTESFTAGDILSLHAPTIVDDALEDISITLQGRR